MNKLMTTVSALTLLPLFTVVAEAGHGYSRGGSGKAYFALVIIAVGYWVLTMAANQKGRLKKLGNWLGGLIIVVSLAGLICSAVFRAKKYCKYSKDGSCSIAACPFKGQAKDDPAGKLK